MTLPIDIASTDESDDMTILDTDIDPWVIAKDISNTKVEENPVNREYSIHIEKRHYMIRRYYRSSTPTNKVKLPMHKSRHTKDSKPISFPHREKHSHQSNPRNHIDDTPLEGHINNGI